MKNTPTHRWAQIFPSMYRNNFYKQGKDCPLEESIIVDIFILYFNNLGENI